MKAFFLILCLVSIEAHLKDNVKRIYVGTALLPDKLEHDSTYKTIATQEFNCLTPDIPIVWDQLEPIRGNISYAPADSVIQFANDNHMKIRGHNLIWYMLLPKWVTQMENNTIELEKAMTKRITEVVTHFKGKIYAWDVVNEPMNEDGTIRQSIFYKNFGIDYLIKAYKLAHENDPDAKLYINEYNVYGGDNKTEGFYNLVKQLLAEGVPIHGVGFQCHLKVGQFPSDLAKTMQRFADLGVEVAVTELDIKIKMPATQADFLQQSKDYVQAFKACLSVNKCVGVTVWQFVDKYSWIPIYDHDKGYGAADLWDENFKPKPAVSSVEEELKKYGN